MQDRLVLILVSTLVYNGWMSSEDEDLLPHDDLIKNSVGTARDIIKACQDSLEKEPDLF